MRALSSVFSRTLAAALFAATLVAVAPATSAAQMTSQEISRARKMLEYLRKDLHEIYYDSTFRGIDIDARARRADSAIQKAPNMNFALGILAQYLADLQDSHTFFLPPTKVARVDYGFGMLTVGDSIYVQHVKKGSDAEKQGLKRGDLVLAFDKMRTTRASWDIIQYVYYALSPRPQVMLTVKHPGDSVITQLTVSAKITERDRITDWTDMSEVNRIISEWEDDARKPTHFYKVFGDSVLVWRMPQFFGSDHDAIDDMIKLAKKYPALILDLRNNGGGSVETDQYLIGKFFDREVEMMKMVQRKKLDTLKTKPSKDPYRGKFVVLVNASSASASEIFSRVMQIEKRATIVGDVTAGAVIASVRPEHDVGFDRYVTFGASISISDVIMSDGKRLEKVGVTPDYRVLPTGQDLAARRDPQMAKALELLGVNVTPAQATIIASAKP